MSNESISKPEPKKSSVKEVFNLVKDYFVNSDEKLVAWLMLIGIVFCVAGFVALMVVLSWWSAGFWAILAAKTLPAFFVSMGKLALIIGGLVGLEVLKNSLIDKLASKWRNWLSKKIIYKLFKSKNNYLDLSRFSENLDNVAQRIQEDIHNFTLFALNLGSGLLNSVLSLGTFVGTLWVIGGSLSFVLLGASIVIPGYLVWLALIIAIAASIATHFIAKSLAKRNEKAEKAEADLRQELETLNQEAENIAEEHAENYHENIINKKLEEININVNKKINTQAKLTTFQNFYMQISNFLPDLLSAPLYFSGAIELAEMMQIGLAFGQVSRSLSWFVENYENIASLRTYTARILELEKALEQDGLSMYPKAIERKEKGLDKIKVKDLNIHSPEANSTKYMMKNLNLKLKAGEHTLIMAQSGFGKSTLFKVISGTWCHGEGKVTVPLDSQKKILFLSQFPTIRDGISLKALLAHPEPESTYTEEEYPKALEKVAGMEKFIPMLQMQKKWSKLSAGEQQRISIVRALLKKPDWLFLDEATAFLDEENEEMAYKTLLSELPTTTLVSIAHRSTVKKHHLRVLRFKLDENEEVEIDEKRRSPAF